MSKQRFAELFLLVTTLIWGSTFVVVKGALASCSPLAFIGFRFLLAALILSIAFYPKIKSLTRAAMIRGSVLGILLYIGFATQTIGLRTTTASKSAFFTGTLVVFTPIFQFLIERRIPKLGNLLGVILAAVGLYFLTSPKGSEFNVGDFLTLVCAMLFGLYIVYLDVVSVDSDRFHLTYVQIVVTGVLGVVIALAFEQIEVNYSAGFIGSVLYLTIFATIITTWVQTRFQGDTSPTRAAVIFTLEPVIAATFAYFVRGETLGTIGIIGGVVIVIGLLVSEFSDQLPILNRSFSLE